MPYRFAGIALGKPPLQVRLCASRGGFLSNKDNSRVQLSGRSGIACACGMQESKKVDLFKHAYYVLPVVLNAAIGDHLKAAINDRPFDEVITDQVHVV